MVQHTLLEYVEVIHRSRPLCLNVCDETLRITNHLEKIYNAVSFQITFSRNIFFKYIISLLSFIKHLHLPQYYLHIYAVK